MTVRYILALTVAMLTACGDDGPEPPGTSGTPVLKRTLIAEHTCTIDTAPIRHAFGWPGNFPRHAAVSTGTTAFVFRSEQVDPFGFEPARLMSSTIDLQGNFGPPSIFGEGTHGGISAIENGDGFAAAWWLDGFFFARFDRDARLIGTAKRLNSPGNNGFVGALVPRAGGFAFFFTAMQDFSTSLGFHVVLLDDEGNATGAPVEISPDRALHVQATAEDGGFTVLWVAEQIRPTSVAAAEVRFTKLDASGALAGATKRISSPPESRVVRGNGFAPVRAALARFPSGYLAAWNEVNEDSDGESGAFSIVVLAKLDAGGNVTETVALDEIEEEFDHEEPLFTIFDQSKVLLSWSRGSHIYTCGGCVPDHSIHTFVLDVEKLEPRSEVLKLAPPGGGLGGQTGGLIAHRFTPIGDKFLATFEVQFHTSNNAGTAALGCR